MQSDVEVKKYSSSSSKSRPGPQFDLLATATLRLEDAAEDVRCHELYLEDGENDRLPPLFGQFCCRLAVQPYCRYSNGDLAWLCTNTALRFIDRIVFVDLYLPFFVYS